MPDQPPVAVSELAFTAGGLADLPLAMVIHPLSEGAREMPSGTGEYPTADQTTRCPRCGSGNTVALDDQVVVGYRKCIICGQRWSICTPRRRARLTTPGPGNSNDSAG